MTVALLFSPQGAQTVGMGRALAEASPAARAAYEMADRALGWPVSRTCWEGPPERLNDTRQTQPCLVATSLACLRALEERLAESGVAMEPALVAGHSVGEYAALVAAGVLSAEDALRLVGRRGELMADAAEDGAMTAVLGIEREVVERAVAAVARPTELVVANDNAPGQVVVSGRRDAIAAAEDALRAAGARRLVPLSVSGPFHSPLMAPVADELERAFETVAWRDARPPVVSNVTGDPETDADRIRALLTEQVRSPVEWVRSVRRMVADGVDTFVECGPGAALVGMVRRIVPSARTLAVSDPETLAAAAQALAAMFPARRATASVDA
ncbi:MAG TPA: ACP S-malonyltransferase [Candidatus Limnocylindria bacterium]|nr:ACP S-malonyltransferase [Candidatus Limnocylindria bacterium]